jgi:hypothetical protein
MIRPVGRVAAVGVLAVAIATAGVSQSADKLICDQIRLLTGVEKLRKSVEDYKATEQLITTLAKRAEKEIEDCKRTPSSKACAPDVLDEKAAQAEKLAGQSRELGTLRQEIERRMKYVEEKKSALEGMLRDKSSCRDGL